MSTPSTNQGNCSEGASAALAGAVASLSLSDFQYTPLQPDQIRLLNIHAGAGDQELLCTLTVSDFSMSSEKNKKKFLPPYEAISYCWGSYDRQNAIACNHGEYGIGDDCTEDEYYGIFPLKNEGVIRVTDNLKALLKVLRLEDDVRTIWVDSICINQEDLQERSEQVLLMDKVYMYAQEVLIWLGEDDGKMSLVVECIESLMSMKEWTKKNLSQPPSIDGCFRPWHLDKDAPGYIPIESWEAFRDFLTTHSWFRRAWVFQEVVVASQAYIIFKDFLLNLDLLYNACEVIQTLNIYVSEPISHPRNPQLVIGSLLFKGRLHAAYARIRGLPVRENLQNWDNLYYLSNFINLLYERRLAESTDPRDKVYALLSIVKDNTGRLPKPDYRLPVKDVYVDVVRYWIENVGEDVKYANLRFLNFVQEPDNEFSLPSWAPNWNMHFTKIMLLYLHLYSGCGADPFNAAGERQAVAALSNVDSKGANDIPILTARGVRILVVQNFSSKGTRWKDEYTKMINIFPDPYPTTTLSYLEAFRLAICPMSAKDYQCTAISGSGNFWKHTNTSLGPSQSASKDKIQASTPRYTASELSSQLPDWFVLGAMGGSGHPAIARTFFTSTSGFMGLAPKGIQKGDEVCVLFGNPIPFLIRRLENGRYTFLGECYIYGVMNGEAMEELDENLIEDFEFE